MNILYSAGEYGRTAGHWDVAVVPPIHHLPSMGMEAEEIQQELFAPLTRTRKRRSKVHSLLTLL